MRLSPSPVLPQPPSPMTIKVAKKTVGNPCLLTETEQLKLIKFLSSPGLEKFAWDIKVIDSEPLHAPHRAIAIGSSINGEFDFGFMFFKRIGNDNEGNSSMKSDISIDMMPPIRPASPPTHPKSPERDIN